MSVRVGSAGTLSGYRSRPCDHAWTVVGERPAALREALKIVAAGSVPVATPPPNCISSGPVATPTEPAYVDLLAILHEDDCEHGNMPEVCARCDEDSPVPAEPARERLTGWFDVTEVPAVQPEER